MPNNNLKVALYCRVAREDQLALETQKDSLLLYAKESGLDKYEIEIFSDNGHNGLNFDRPAFSKMEEAIRAGTVGAVVVKDISRIGRNFLDTGDWLQRLKDNGTVFIETTLSPKDNFLRNKGCFQKFMEGGAINGRKDHPNRKIRRAAFRG